MIKKGTVLKPIDCKGLDKEKFENEYYINKLSFQTISKKYDIPAHQIYNLAKKYCIISRPKLVAVKLKKGDVVGTFTIVRRARLEEIKDKNKHKNTFWVCTCNNCNSGKERIIPYGQMLYRKGCGCRRIKGYKEISQTFWSITKQRAKEGGLEFTITIEEMWEQYLRQDRKCYFTGLPIYFSRSRSTKQGIVEQTASPDRIDPMKGYSKDNIVWVHKNVNVIKGALTEEEFIKMCYLVTRQFYEPENVEIPSEYLFHRNKRWADYMNKRGKKKDA